MNRFLFFEMVIFLTMFGCSADDGRFDVRGDVTYHGQPIPMGRIVFSPDPLKGNSGPQGYAVIQAGKYDTRRTGQGMVGGPMTVKIQGFTGKDNRNENDDSLHGPPLFSEYTVDIDLPAKNCEHHFDVPH